MRIQLSPILLDPDRVIIRSGDKEGFKDVPLERVSAHHLFQSARHMPERSPEGPGLVQNGRRSSPVGEEGQDLVFSSFNPKGKESEEGRSGNQGQEMRTGRKAHLPAKESYRQTGALFGPDQIPGHGNETPFSDKLDRLQPAQERILLPAWPPE